MPPLTVAFREGSATTHSGDPAPFARPGDLATMAARVRDPVVPVRVLRPDVPADLEAVVLRCLEKDAGRRFLDAASLERASPGAPA
jgi:eukaryotic-like serine/threonine-protein kinase